MSGRPRELNATETKLSDQMVAAWTNFANTENPNGSGNSPWPKFTADDGGQYFVEDIPPSTKSVAQFRADYRCDFLGCPVIYKVGSDATAQHTTASGALTAVLTLTNAARRGDLQMIYLTPVD